MSEKYTYQSFRNESNSKFIDISSELWREYIRQNDDKTEIITRIDEPIALNVSKSGGHRLFDANGECHYIPSGWNHLKWKVKDDQPHFVA